MKDLGTNQNQQVSLEPRPVQSPMLWCGLAVLLLVVAAVVYALVHFHLSGMVFGRLLPAVHHLHRQLINLGWVGPLLLIAIIGLHGIFFVLPIELPMVVAVYLYGPLWGVLYTWMGSVLAAHIGYFLARSLGKTVLRRWVKPSLFERVQRGGEAVGGWGLLLLRFIPLVSFNALNYASGLARIPLARFAWTTALGVLATDTVMAFLYEGALNAAWGTVMLGAAAAVLGVGMAWHLHRRLHPGG